jgi:hypothetical protein
MISFPSQHGCISRLSGIFLLLESRFDPNKYGMSFCPECKGTGKFFDQHKNVRICNVCGGFGWIKNERNHVSDEKESTEIPGKNLDHPSE